jgi:hypothetical protein
MQAADALSVLGIGRNEYIAALNACKARRLMWRANLNRDSIVREHLPQVGLGRGERWGCCACCAGLSVVEPDGRRVLRSAKRRTPPGPYYLLS